MIEFAQPAALWTALALGLPLLAHMAYRRVTEKFYFPSLRFIRPSQIPRTGKRTPTDIPLLILRMLYFLALAFLLADPYWKSDALSVTEQGSEETLIAIDLSPSMSGWRGLEEAKEEALNLIENTPGKLGLLGFGHSIIVKVEIGNNRESVRAAIQSLSVDWGRGNAQVLLDQAPKLFSEQAVRRNLVIISDFQESDWQTAYSESGNQGIVHQLIKVGDPDGVGGKRPNNLSVLEGRAVPAGPGKIRVWAVIRNWDDVNKTATVELIAGGETRLRNLVSVPPLGSAQTQFMIKEGDFAEAMIKLTGLDEFEMDNQRSVWLKAPPSKRFGFWMPEFEDEGTDSEKSFLKTAVSSSGDNGWNRWEWDQDRTDSIRLGDDQMDIELLMVLGLGKWFEDEQLGEFLVRFLSNGGVALVTPGEPFSSAVSVLKSNKLLDFNFVRVAGGAVRGKNPFRIGALEEDSVLGDVFSGKSARDLYLSAIHRFGIMKPGSGAGSVDIPLRDREGRPLAIVRQLDGGGRLVFLPFRMNTGWTDLPLRNSFLPLLMELTRSELADAGSPGWPVLEPGNELLGIEGSFKAKEPGTFRFEDQWVEVVLSPAESSPATVSVNEIYESLGVSGTEVNEAFLAESIAEEERNPLWMWFAIFAATLLIIEMLWSRPLLQPSTQNQIHA